MRIRPAFFFALGLLPLAGCGAAAKEDEDCLKKVETLRQERDAHLEQDVAKLRAMAIKSEKGQLSLEEQAAYADFMVEIENRENRINAEIQRCPEAARLELEEQRRPSDTRVDMQ